MLPFLKGVNPDPPEIPKQHNKWYCALGEEHNCPLNVNDGYCAAKECQFKVEGM